jgi:hypothetical protein
MTLAKAQQPGVTLTMTVIWISSSTDEIRRVCRAGVYRNFGNGAFSDSGAVIEPFRLAATAWGDYDRDGDLDLMIIGEIGESPYLYNYGRIYRNDGSSAFAELVL